MSLIGTKWAFNFISFIGWFTFRIITKENLISNKMFTQTVRELEKVALFPEKFSCSSSQSGIQIDREEDRLKIF
jgi:hypothetical protein